MFDKEKVQAGKGDWMFGKGKFQGSELQVKGKFWRSEQNK